MGKFGINRHIREKGFGRAKIPDRLELKSILSCWRKGYLARFGSGSWNTHYPFSSNKWIDRPTGGNPAYADADACDGQSKRSGTGKTPSCQQDHEARIASFPFGEVLQYWARLADKLVLIGANDFAWRRSTSKFTLLPLYGHRNLLCCISHLIIR